MPNYRVVIDAVMRASDGEIGEEIYEIEAPTPEEAHALLVERIGQAFIFPGHYPMTINHGEIVGWIRVN